VIEKRLRNDSKGNLAKIKKAIDIYTQCAIINIVSRGNPMTTEVENDLFRG
jgi:hypothetical protein